MLAATCPSPHELRNYALGDCDEEISRRIEDHLADCSGCEETLAQFDTADDTLTRYVPLAASVDVPAEDVGWLERLRAGPPTGAKPNEGSSGDEAQEAFAATDPTFDFLGPYRLLACIGRGGMSLVYRAVHSQLDRVVALKVLAPRLLASPAARARFDREIQIIGQLDHPGIVRASDAGRHGRVAFLVMEHIDGIDLSRLVRQTGPLPLAEACAAARQIAQALAAAHQAGAVHRDVKPSNVMLDRGGNVKLLDFGLAHLASEASVGRETTLGRLLGTLDYMSPEQATGSQSLDHRTDLYGLGATLFYLLMGRPPHGSSSDRPLLAQLKQIAEQDPPSLGSVRSDVPAALSELISKLLARDPAVRPDSADSVAAQLAEYAGGDLSARVQEAVPPEADLHHADQQQLAEAEASLMQWLGDDASPNTPKQESAARTLPRGGRRRWFRAGLAMLVVLLFTGGWLGITLLLKTPEGTLEIVSEVDDVRVELVDEANRVHPVQVDQGTKKTLIRAGHYRVRLAAEHDALEIDRDRFTLRAGEQVVARIRYVDRPETEPPKVEEEPLYRGQSRAAWRDRFQRERAAEAKQEAAQALLSLADQQPLDEQVDLWVEIGAELGRPYGMQLPLQSLVFSSSVWRPTTIETLVDLGAQTKRPMLATPPSGRLITYDSLQHIHDRAQRTPWDQLAPRLAKYVDQPGDAKFHYAASLLADMSGPFTAQRHPELADRLAFRVLKVPAEDTNERIVRHLLAARIRPQNPNAIRWLQTAKGTIRHEASEDIRVLAANAWLAQAVDVAVPTETIAGMLGELLIFDLERGLIWQEILSLDNFPRSREFLQQWPEVAADLIDRMDSDNQDEASTNAITHLFETIDRILGTLPATAIPELPKARATIDRHLRARYVVKDESSPEVQLPPDVVGAVSTDLLLRNYWRLHGEIPGYVRDGQPADSFIREQLAQLEGRDWGPFRTPIHRLTPSQRLLTEAPYHTARIVLMFHPNLTHMRPDRRAPGHEYGVDFEPDDYDYAYGYDSSTQVVTDTDQLLRERHNRAHNIARSLELGPGYEPLGHFMMAIMAEQCGASQERDRFFAKFFRQASVRDSYSRLVAESTLDGLRMSEGIRRIITKAQDYALVTQAIDVGVNSQWLREELEQLEPIWSERFETGRATSPEEAVDFLTYVGSRWQTDAGRAAVEIIEEAIAEQDPPQERDEIEKLTIEKLHYLCILGALADYDLSRVVPHVKTWSEPLRATVQERVESSTPTLRAIVDRLRRPSGQEPDEEIEQRILELLQEVENGAPDSD